MNLDHEIEKIEGVHVGKCIAAGTSDARDVRDCRREVGVAV